MAVALISGATKGIGRATAFALAEAEYDLAICARTLEDLQSMKEKLKKKFGHAEVFIKQADLSDQEQTSAFGRAVLDRFGRVDALFNNAGLFEPGSISDDSLEKLRATMEINLYSAYRLTRLLLPSMVEAGRGHIFNLCSVASLRAYPNGSSYCISKHALLGFSRALREELKEKGIRVTSVFPGATWSASWEGADFPESRLMKPEDIASAMLSALQLGQGAVVEDIVIRPQLGDL